MNEQFDKKPDSVYSKRLKAGKRRTYFFDVRATRGNDYFITITESRKRLNDEGYDRHKIFLYKEDFHKFIKGLDEAITYVKTELMPDFNFDAFNHDQDDWDSSNDKPVLQKPVIAPDLLNKGVFEDEPVFDGEPSIAHRDIIDGADREGYHEQTDSKPTIEGKTIINAGFTEEVDKW